MEFAIKNVPFKSDQYEITEELAKVLHSEDFQALNMKLFSEMFPGERRNDARKLNFEVGLNTGHSGVQTDGTGYLRIPELKIARKFLDQIRKYHLRINVQNRTLYFTRSDRKIDKGKLQQLLKVPYQDPTLEKERKSKILQMDRALRVDKLHFGIWAIRPQANFRGIFCSEWQKAYTSIGNAVLRFEYDHKLLRVQLGEPALDEIAYSVVIKFSNVRNVWIGYEFGNPFVGFDLLTPPILEQEWFNRALTGEISEDQRKFRQRIGSLEAAHAIVSPYAHHMMMTLYSGEYLDEFSKLCAIAGLKKPSSAKIEVESHSYYSQKNLSQVRNWLKSTDWSVAFQVEALLHNGLLSTDQLLRSLRKPVTDFHSGYPHLAGDALRRLVENLQSLSISDHTLLSTFEKICAGLIANPGRTNFTSSDFNCYHVTFTPTRMTLEGPYVTQSNRVIRLYKDYHNHFVRVDFRDEDRLQYRWDREVDGSTLLQERVGTILKHGFILAGRHFEFLAYSSSGLRDHAVWFVNPFQHTTEGLVDAARIRQNLGDFSGVLDCPSKFAARLAQAFTATDPSVTIHSPDWVEIPDMGPLNYEYTNGVGTISHQLADKIWEKLCSDRPDFRYRSMKPSAYQIRFLGYKGVVSVDDELDGIKMCLRPSMNKFDDPKKVEANIEIALAFSRPGVMYLNRGLITILEDRGVRPDAFMTLQEMSVAEARTAYSSLRQSSTLLKAHKLGDAYNISYIFRELNALGLDFFCAHDIANVIKSSFLRSIVHCSVNTILQDVKYGARIRVPDSWKLVGVTDEGPAYKARGHENVYCLDEGEIFVCIQEEASSEPRYLKGNIVISRSPTVHPGDVQRVWGVGKPPDDMLCLFRNLRNVVVFPSVGQRSLPSCLAGGDLDGDLYDVCCYPSLLPTLQSDPASYPPVPKRLIDTDEYTDENGLNQEKVIPHVCDFVVEYINSDVLGLLSDNHLIRADQSAEGVFDSGCMKLATLCSQAVDYPKNGVAVDIRDAPRRLIPYKPDWKKGEETGDRKTDFYESTRALGILYRAIDIDGPKTEAGAALAPGVFVDPITRTLDSLVLKKTFAGCDYEKEIKMLFEIYYNELKYITATHTLSNLPDTRLLEEEVVVGTILAQCSQNRWRKERITRLRLHSSTLVVDTKRGFLPRGDLSTIDDVREGLGKAWQAWRFASRQLEKQNDGFGYNSFGLIVLGVVFECLQKLAAPL